MFRFTISAAAVAAISLFQLTRFAFIGSVKPNFVLVLLLFLSFLYKDWLKRLILVFIAAIILKYQTGFDIQNILFVVSVLVGSAIIDRIRFAPFLTAFIALISATALINLYSFDIGSFFLESVYNVLTLVLLFTVLNLWRER